jgi:hypothetical protein
MSSYFVMRYVVQYIADGVMQFLRRHDVNSSSELGQNWADFRVYLTTSAHQICVLFAV